MNGAACLICLQATNLFTGSEDLSHLSEAQMTALLVFDDWPQPHEGPGDVNESEGLGGLMMQVQKEASTHAHTSQTEAGSVEEDNSEESEDHADRRYALSPGGPRDEFAPLVEVDALVAELKEQDDKGALAGYPDWRDDVVTAERIFLDTPDELPSWLERMRIKNLSKQEKKVKLVELADSLVKSAVTAIPPPTWNADLASAQDPSREPTKEEALVNRLGFVFLAYRVDFYWWESIEM